MIFKWLLFIGFSAVRIFLCQLTAVQERPRTVCLLHGYRIQWYFWWAVALSCELLKMQWRQCYWLVLWPYFETRGCQVSQRKLVEWVRMKSILNGLSCVWGNGFSFWGELRDLAPSQHENMPCGFCLCKFTRGINGGRRSASLPPYLSCCHTNASSISPAL